MVYFFLCSIWAIFTLATHTYPSLESGEPLRLLSPTGYLWISAANVAFALPTCLTCAPPCAAPGARAGPTSRGWAWPQPSWSSCRSELT